ncbi:MAG TPA: 50S ribosomal protein L29 [Prolixibacteraceae bacterium]|nr:50S ribosomal protein L29 [Prolixibacteraceae bacterium]HPT30295.1 50S ribosomal protein L29 [Prolixibacteraceae bacterium]
MSMKIAEIKELSNKELLERLQNEQETLTRLRMNHSVSPLDNPMKIRDTRRNIARMMTVLSTRDVK